MSLDNLDNKEEREMSRLVVVKTLIRALLALSAFAMIVFVVVGFGNGSQDTATWLKLPISELKVWELLLILFVTAALARDD